MKLVTSAGMCSLRKQEEYLTRKVVEGFRHIPTRDKYIGCEFPRCFHRIDQLGYRRLSTTSPEVRMLFWIEELVFGPEGANLLHDQTHPNLPRHFNQHEGA